jgi:hypothetical protein
MNWIALAGAIGIGAIITKVLDVVWLQQIVADNERKKWLRDQRLRAYSVLSQDLIGMRQWLGLVSNDEAQRRLADTLLLTSDHTLAKDLEAFVNRVTDLQRTAISRERELQPLVNVEARPVWEAENRAWFEQLSGDAHRLFGRLREELTKGTA